MNPAMSQRGLIAVTDVCLNTNRGNNKGTTMTKLSLAPNPVFWSLQGEGHLRGFAMAFVRLAGCPIGCVLCDTDYSVDSRRSIDEIVQMVLNVTPKTSRDKWVWLTGGEPSAQPDCIELLNELKKLGYSTAVATAGHERWAPPVDWLSVSPHTPSAWRQLYGNEVKIVSGLNGYHVSQFLKEHPDDQTDFWYRYVSPLSFNGAEKPESLAACLEFLKDHPNWSLSRQDHLYWGVP